MGRVVATGPGGRLRGWVVLSAALPEPAETRMDAGRESLLVRDPPKQRGQLSRLLLVQIVLPVNVTVSVRRWGRDYGYLPLF